MNPHADCWRCGTRLEMFIDGIGRTVASCIPCSKEIAELRKERRQGPTGRIDRECQWCGKDRGRREVLCDACHREDRLRQQRDCQARLREKRGGLAVVRRCHGCLVLLERFRRKWCPACAQEEQRGINHHKYILRRAAARCAETRRNGPRVCQACGVRIKRPQRKWCVCCGADAGKRAIARSKTSAKREALRKGAA